MGCLPSTNWCRISQPSTVSLVMIRLFLSLWTKKTFTHIKTVKQFTMEICWAFFCTISWSIHHVSGKKTHLFHWLIFWPQAVMLIAGMRVGTPDCPQNIWENMGSSSGKLTVCELENGPVEIVDFPIKNGGSVHSFLYVYQRVIIWIFMGQWCFRPWDKTDLQGNLSWNSSWSHHWVPHCWAYFDGYNQCEFTSTSCQKGAHVAAGRVHPRHPSGAGNYLRKTKPTLFKQMCGLDILASLRYPAKKKKLSWST